MIAVDQALRLSASLARFSPPVAHHDRAARELYRMVAGLPIRSALEIAAGSGHFTDVLREAGVWTVAVDRNPMLQGYRNRADAAADMHAVPVKADSFDLVVWRHALEHTPIPLAAILEGKRVARRYLLAVVPTDTDKMVWWGDHVSALGQRQWERLFGLVGLRTVAFEVGDFSESPNEGVDLELRYLLEKEQGV